MRQAPRDQAADAALVRVAGRHIAEVGGRQIARARIPQGSADALVLVIVAPRVAVVSRATVVSGVTVAGVRVGRAGRLHHNLTLLAVLGPAVVLHARPNAVGAGLDRKSTRLNSSH